MSELMTCSRCSGFAPPTAAVCPHCDARPAPIRRRWRRVLGLAGSASLGLTMMACYGGPPVPAAAPETESAPAPVAVAAAPETETTPARR